MASLRMGDTQKAARAVPCEPASSRKSLQGSVRRKALNKSMTAPHSSLLTRQQRQCMQQKAACCTLTGQQLLRQQPALAAMWCGKALMLR